MSILMNLRNTAAIAAAVMSLTGIAQAQSPYAAPGSDRYASDRYAPQPGYHRHDYRRHSHYRTCGADRRMRANNGTAIGAVSGGVLGSALGGGKLGNVLLGAGAGAVAGHAIGSRTTRC